MLLGHEDEEIIYLLKLSAALVVKSAIDDCAHFFPGARRGRRRIRIWWGRRWRPAVAARAVDRPGRRESVELDDNSDEFPVVSAVVKVPLGALDVCTVALLSLITMPALLSQLIVA